MAGLKSCAFCCDFLLSKCGSLEKPRDKPAVFFRFSTKVRVTAASSDAVHRWQHDFKGTEVLLLYQAYTDPSCCAILKARGPKVVDWIQRMLEPKSAGDFETLESLAPTLQPIFSQEVGPRFLAWSNANAQAWQAGEKQTQLAMGGQSYFQKTFKYPALGFAIIKQKFAAANSDPAIEDFLAKADCLKYLV